MNYAQWQTAITTLMVSEVTDPNYIAIEPSIISYAENRILRDLNLIGFIARDASASLTADSRTFTLPAAAQTFTIIHAINVISPAGSTLVTGGMRVPLQAVSRDVIDLFCPDEAADSLTSIPKYFSMLTDKTILVGPSPGAAFKVEVVGYTRPATLSASNTTTLISTLLPDLFLAASMIFASGYMKNYGAQADDPRQAMSWEGQYKTLLEGADGVEARRNFAGASWSSQDSEPNAAPQRG